MQKFPSTKGGYLILWTVRRYLLPIVIGVAVGHLAVGGESPEGRLERVYREARVELDGAQTNSVDPLWKFARACFDYGEVARSDGERATVAEQGIQAAREAIRRKYGSAAAHYYLALDLGELARTKSLGALKLVREMEVEFKEAIRLDERFDYAGPHRSLGLLYKDAPGWPTSIGNRTKARQHLRRAVELSPDYPDNQLSLTEAYAEWGETAELANEVPVLEQVMESAKPRFVGNDWELSWADWEKRFARLKVRVNRPTNRAGSPRGNTK